MNWVIASLTLFVVIAMLGFMVRYLDSLEAHNRAAEMQLRSAAVYDKALKQRADEIRRFKHDARGLLQAIEFACSVEDGDGAGANPEWLDETSIDLVGGDSRKQVIGSGVEPGESAAEAARSPVSHAGWAKRSPNASCGVEASRACEASFPLLRAIIGLKQSQCTQAGIEFSCKWPDETGMLGDVAMASQAVNVEEHELCAVVQNLLENAYEASLALRPEGAPFVDIAFSTEPGQLGISVRNRTASDEPPTFKTNKSDPEQHGFGLVTVERIAGRHKGDVTFSFDASSHALTVSVTLRNSASN